MKTMIVLLAVLLSAGSVALAKAPNPEEYQTEFVVESAYSAGYVQLMLADPARHTVVRVYAQGLRHLWVFSPGDHLLGKYERNFIVILFNNNGKPTKAYYAIQQTIYRR